MSRVALEGPAIKCRWTVEFDISKGHFACSKAAVLEMAKQKSGRIINFSSRGSFYGSMGSLAYGTAKAGILGFTAMLAKTLTAMLAKTLKEFNITANCILPSAAIGLVEQGF